MDSSEIFFGYYIFLGLGDYHCPENLNNEWTYTWNKDEWEKKLDYLIKLGMNTLLVYLNGHKLPYQSQYYPNCVDSLHPNVKNNFFSDILKIARAKGLGLIAVFTTTGHANFFSQLNPETSIVCKKDTTADLFFIDSFPKNTLTDKNKCKAGNAQLGLGILCHNNPLSISYTLNIIDECLELYPEFDGIALHPPETLTGCYCKRCCEKYGGDLFALEVEAARNFFIEDYLDIQRNVIEPFIYSRKPNTKLFCFTIPWMFEPNAINLISKIDKEVTLIDWDYNLQYSRLAQLSNRLKAYQKIGHKVWFMPGAGFGFNDLNKNNLMKKLQLQLQLAKNGGASGIIHFLGPRWPKYIEEIKSKEWMQSRVF